MAFTRVPRRKDRVRQDPRIYADLDELVRLQFKAEGFSFLPRQPVHSVLFGRHASRLRGRGLNFEELRDYFPGDDIRNVDWKATARSGSPQLRVYNEERDRSVWLLVSQCQSMFFGSQEKMKSVCAAEAAALAAWRVLSSGDRVGAIVFGDRDFEIIPPKRSRGQVMRILNCVVDRNHQLGPAQRESEQPVSNDPTRTDPKDDDPTGTAPSMINQVLMALTPLATHDCLICMIGDGGGVNAQSVEIATRLNAHNDLILTLVHDPMETCLPDGGTLSVVDDGQFMRFDSSRRRVRERFADHFDERLKRLTELSRRQSIPLIRIDTVTPVIDQIRSALGHSHSPRRV